MDNRFLRLKDVISVTGLSRSSIYAKIQEGKFPHSIKIGVRSVAWQASAVSKWIEDRITEAKVAA